MAHHRARPAHRRLVIGAGLALAAAGGGMLALKRRRAGASAAESDLATCACGQRFRTAGVPGRHQVYWLIDAPETDPILGDRCPACDRPLAEADAAAPTRG
jgi:hypothetical protein